MLFDRSAEVEALDRVLGAARDGLSGALVLSGEAGIGKTVLLDHVAAGAKDMQVTRVVAVESEMELGFASLHQLLVPFIAGLERLPSPQREALGSAFGLTDGPPADRFLVGLAVLTLLSDAAASRPLLCVVDDAQWLDRTSAEVLGFVARRLFADRIAMLFGVRDPLERQLALDGLAELHLGGLPDREAGELLASVTASQPDRRVVDRLVAETRGNPLALVEVAGELTPAELAGGLPLREPLPLGKQLEARFLDRVRAMAPGTQTLLLIAAADPAGDPVLLWRAAEGLGLGPQDAESAGVDHVIELVPRVVFRHPLMRSAVYHGASPSARRRVHEALAVATDQELDADRHAWHLASAAVGPDEDVAAELERSAESAGRRGGYAAAARALARAAELSVDDERRARRRLRAAQAELAGGSPVEAAELLEPARARLSDPHERAEATRLDAWIRFALGDGGPVPELLLDAAQALKPLNPIRAREVLLEAMEASLYAGLSVGDALTRSIARVVRATPIPRGTRPSAADLLLDGIARLDQNYAEGARLVQRALAADQGGELRGLARLAAGELRDDMLLHTLNDRALQRARERGDVVAMLAGLAFKVMAEVLAGRLASAQAAAEEGRELAVATGNVGVFSAAGTFGVQHFGGSQADVSKARDAATTAMQEAGDRGMIGHRNYVRAGMTLLELGNAKYAEAAKVGRLVFEEDPFYFGTAILPDLIEAALRAEEPALARAALARLSERSVASGTELAQGVLARSRALLADSDDAEHWYRLAISHLERTQSPPELARARLLYGEWLRRQRRRVDARQQLRLALDMFASMDISGFATRARLELLATGEHARERVARTRDELTAQETQIAGLASEGASNREIAAQLFISPATVAYHLRKVFRKLDISSRSRLIHALAAKSDTEHSEPSRTG